MKHKYIAPSFTQMAFAVENMIAGSFKNKLGTDEMTGDEALVKEDSGNFWGDPEEW